MYAIVEIAGQQFKVEEGRKIYVHRLEAEEGKKVEFDKVLLVEDEDKILIGEPFIKDFVVEGTVLNDKVRGDKVIVFKKKRRKGYRVKNGHRQDFTQIEILRIGDKKASTGKKDEVTAAEAGREVKPAEKTGSTEKEGTVKKTGSAEKAVTAKKSSTKKSGKAAEEVRAEKQDSPESEPAETKAAEEVRAEKQDSPESEPDETKAAEEVRAEKQDSPEKDD